MSRSTSISPGLLLQEGLFDLRPGEIAGLAAALVLCVTVGWICAAYPASLPAWAPWEFSWTQFLTAILALGWYARGVALLPADERPSLWRQGAFVIGLGAIYAVLLTHFLYMAQHMFFLNRLQHLVMHHLGPMLIALSWPGKPLLRGMPAPLRRLIEGKAAGRMVRFIQQPVLAGILFVGLIYLWLIPAVHFRAMIDPQLYTVMNWSMVIDGVLFWCLVLDPRPSPPARTGFAMRMIVTVLVMFPQILLGATVTFSTTVLYPYYDLCGRLFPSVPALLDQHIGGVILWIPSAMMSSVAFMLTLNSVRRHEEQMVELETDPAAREMALLARSWTGR